MLDREFAFLARARHARTRRVRGRERSARAGRARRRADRAQDRIASTWRPLSCCRLYWNNGSDPRSSPDAHLDHTSRGRRAGLGAALRLSNPQARSGTVRAHVATALAWLFIVLASVGFGSVTAYYAFVDSFIAPAILSPDSDVALTSKLRLGELEVERARAAADIEGIDADIETASAAMLHLEELRKASAMSIQWTASLTSQRVASGATELRSLMQRKGILSHLLEEQRTLAERARTDVESGVISRTQYAKEAQSVGQIELELLENDRAIEQSALHGRESALVQQGLAQKGAAFLSCPSSQRDKSR